MDQGNREHQDNMASIVWEAAHDLLRADLGKEGRPRFLLGITGCPGAGKSTFSALLAAALNKLMGKETAIVVPMDGFHLPNTVLEERGLRSLKGIPETFDAEKFIKLLGRLRRDLPEKILCPIYDRELLDDRVENAIEVESSKRIIIVEGNYLLLDDPPWNQARHELDQVWYLDAPREITEKRLVQRHMDGGRNLEQALKKVEETDLPNTSLVERTRICADKVVKLHDS
jgi:pantothenate kinase